MKFNVAAAFATAVLAITTIASTTIYAYVPLGGTWGQGIVPYYLNPVNMDLPSAAIEPAIRAGADAWHDQSGAGFLFAFAGLTNQATDTNDGVNLVMFRNASSASAIATTYTWFSGTRLIDADIVFWDAGFQFFTGTTGCTGGFYIEDVATHEFGHALGLAHSTVPTATMYPSITTCSQQTRTLDPDDIAGVLFLYPPSLTPPPPPTGLRIIR